MKNSQFEDMIARKRERDTDLEVVGKLRDEERYLKVVGKLRETDRQIWKWWEN